MITPCPTNDQPRKRHDHPNPGDTVVVHSMDRLARNLSDLLHLVQSLTARGVVVEFLKERLVFTGEDAPVATLMLSVMGAVAEFERTLIRERQREGIALAKKKGVYRGRRPTLRPPQIEELRKRVDAGSPRRRSPNRSASVVSPCIACCGSTNPGTRAEDHALFASRRSRPGRGIQTSSIRI